MNTYSHEWAIFIGRFQPFHNAHLRMIRVGLQTARHLIIVLGSHRSSSNIKNPWSAEEREEMIKTCLLFEDLQRVHFIHVRDYLYNEGWWTTDLQTKVKELTGDSKDIALIGHLKDESSFYLKGFPQWTLIEVPQAEPLSATDIRESLFTHDPSHTWKKMVPGPIADFLQRFRGSDKFVRLAEEHAHVQSYKAAWAKAPYPPTFVTTDCVVVKSGHVLVVKRRAHPGKGLLALPGGFIQQNETILKGAVRELKEETGIKLPPHTLIDNLKEVRVFDHPDRSLRGRTVTHSHFFDLGVGTDMPRVKGDDDAEKAFWLPLSDVGVLEDQFFEDHVHQIRYFTSRY